MKTIHRTSAFKSLLILVLWGYERDFPCVQNHYIEGALGNNQDNVYISRGRLWNRIYVSVRKDRGMNGWEEVMRRNKLTTDVYRSHLFVKKPKVSYQLCVEIFCHWTRMGKCVCCSWKTDHTCTDINWKNSESLLCTDGV